LSLEILIEIKRIKEERFVEIFKEQAKFLFKLQLIISFRQSCWSNRHEFPSPIPFQKIQKKMKRRKKKKVLTKLKFNFIISICIFGYFYPRH